MRAILEQLKTGEVGVYEVPLPELRPGGVLVRTAYSAISSGTERATVEIGKKSLLEKAIARPDLVRQVIEQARANGIKAAYQKVQAKLDTLKPMGYSCSGTIVAVADNITDLRPGDRVACAGAGYATHAETNFVPRNLVVRVPDTVDLRAASLATIGAIAMQGVRQAQVTVGETLIVIGAGLVGVLAVKIARGAGCRVIAIDRDPQRTQRALDLGAHAAFDTSRHDLISQVAGCSRYGADAVLLTAATPSADPITLATKLLRDRGRIVVVGDVGMDVPRSDMYHKELSVVMSRSYGPGRYDPQYEELGHDYPIGFVRWTEQRNLEAFLDLLSSGAIDVAPLLQSSFPTSEAAAAYDAIRRSSCYTAIIDYGVAHDGTHVTTGTAALTAAPHVRAKATDKLRVGCIGAGSFARGVILPQLRSNSQVSLAAVATATGVGAESARRSFQFIKALTPAELLESEDVDAVFVLSRHDTHAQYTATALERHKAVFVEKPIATTRRQLQLLSSVYHDLAAHGPSPFVMGGYNRRFAPATQKIRDFFIRRSEAMMVQIRVNAGYLAADHWVHADGGRIVGELCHFVDWARYIVGYPIEAVKTYALPDGCRYHSDNVSSLLRFTDGSVANIVYVANGDRSVSKEYFEVFCGGAVAQLDDFVRLKLAREGATKVIKLDRNKGHQQEMALTVAAMRAGDAPPIPFDELVEVAEATFAISTDIKAPSVEVHSGSQAATAVMVTEWDGYQWKQDS